MEEYPTKDEVDNLTLEESTKDNIDNIIVVEPIDEWTQFRLGMTNDKFNT